VVLEEAVALRRRLGRPALGELARSLNDLGVTFTAVREFERAETALLESLALRRSVSGDTDRAAGVTASNLAAAYYAQEDYRGAERQGRVALDLLRASVGPDHQRTIIAQSNLTAYLMYAGETDAAIEGYRDLLARQARLQGEDHPVTNRVRRNLVMVLRRRTDEASILETETLARELIRAARREGRGGLDLELEALESLRRSLEAQDRWAEALEVIDMAMVITDSLPDIADRHYRYYRAMVRSELGDAEGASVDMGDYIEWLEESGEPEDDELTRRRLRYAELLIAAEQFGRADSVLQVIRAEVRGEAISDGARGWFARLDAARASTRR
jgi:tetratricopeptide (TPR) repeat protein